MAAFNLATLRRGAVLTAIDSVGGWYWPLAAEPANRYRKPRPARDGDRR